MEKRNVYLFQPTFYNPDGIFLPYAIGALASYAWKFEDIAEQYELKDCFFKREQPDLLVSGLEEPFLVGFSSYMWNIEYNKCLAQKIKERFPSCIVLFGGQQIPDESSMLETYPFIDILIHREGEVPFRDLLRALMNGTPLSEVDCLSYRENGQVFETPQTLSKEFDFPSPYASGFFDELMARNPDTNFISMVETNRGCPNHCAYCSWAGKSKVRLFPLERVYGDIEWIVRHKMEFLGFSDANFGLFPRDEQIVDKIIEYKKTTGYPQVFQVSFDKNSSDRVFRISKKLNENRMDKGVTLSFQSMSAEVQENIFRSNMHIDQYKQLIDLYASAGIPSYTDLILGLPGETRESYRDGIEKLLDYGQHAALFVHLCEWLPCAPMAQKAYMEKYAIRYSKIPINQPHRSLDLSDGIPEYSRIITTTSTMTREDWKYMVLFSTCVLCFHHLGMLQFVSRYLYHAHDIPYTSFYDDLLRYMLSPTVRDSSCGVFDRLDRQLDEALLSKAQVVVFDARFGNVAWPFEEYAFLSLLTQENDLYALLMPFLAPYFPEKEIMEDLLSFQRFALKKPGETQKEISVRWDWRSYFEQIPSDQHAPMLTRRDMTLRVDDALLPDTWEEYAKRIVWFGRRGGRTIYLREMQATPRPLPEEGVQAKS